MALFKKVSTTISGLRPESLEQERKTLLQPLIDFIQNKVSNNQEVRINFICTHNSRRSHLAQVWAQTFAYYYTIKNLTCYSGGTESTALFPMVATALEQSGMVVNALSSGNNPIYSVKFSENTHPVIGFSKTWEHAFNPVSGFAAVMTCSQADGDCPFIPGAEKRIPITYEDPKAFDDTPQQVQKYFERSLEIATELNYVFSQIKS